MNRLFGVAVLTTAAASTIGFALTACESATNLDVTYGDAHTSTEASVDAEDAGTPGQGIPALPGCPCDELAGLGCCFTPPGQEPFCTDSVSFCASRKGILFRCAQPNPLTESACCWHLGAGNTAAGASTAYASACDGGAPACTSDGDCAGTKFKCQMPTCPGMAASGIGVGASAETPPPCPTP
jgi:hypothetical protein